jgi:uncharacterized protein YozE (UPF0346 family)
MPAMISFYDWLTKQKQSRTPVGNLAREAERDKNFPRDVASLEVLLGYVREAKKGAGQAQALVIARTAYQAYERSQRPPPNL